MSSALNLQCTILSHIRPHILEFSGHPRKTDDGIKRFQCFSRLLNPCNLRSNLTADFSKQAEFKTHGLLLCAHDFLLHFFQFRRHKPFRIRQCLLADIVFRDL